MGKINHPTTEELKLKIVKRNIERNERQKFINIQKSNHDIAQSTLFFSVKRN